MTDKPTLGVPGQAGTLPKRPKDEPADAVVKVYQHRRSGDHVMVSFSHCRLNDRPPTPRGFCHRRFLAANQYIGVFEDTLYHRRKDD